MKRTKKEFWERFLIYPSFNTRFVFTLTIIVIIFVGLLYFFLVHTTHFDTTENILSLLNLAVQSLTLVLGLFATYYALRQLVETRFTGLDEAGSQEFHRGQYSRAFDKWKEAFFIRPEVKVLLSLLEALLMSGDQKEFDHYILMIESELMQRKAIFIESSDKIILLFLRAMRHLLIKNQGEAEKFIIQIVEIASKEKNENWGWNFYDIKRCDSYVDMKGECKVMAENLSAYLSGQMTGPKLEEFESGNFSIKEEEIVQTTIPIVTPPNTP